MPRLPSYRTLTSVEDIQRVSRESVHHVYARVADRDDVALYGSEGIRERGGKLEINAGEWGFIEGTYTSGYINEEWIPTIFVYVLHHCYGCTYPPNMCCMQGYWDDPDADYDQGWADLNYLPDVKIVEIEEGS